ncbi:ATP-binding cassette domain-containing protein [Histidinibacterium aquaticum]|uniref:ATP-binding cassette domain-containing protein n=1 Tax=Histidinibacterium aquaticum TaxID=2613962 RepID=A0A5J5GGY0_9RHOB|nr:ATP-binding cassette domain-containing protein [Histidinibacterium aquaticum]KAA9007012.1 ATP-binding cassette domain-containing protein [Histidinibacterium aquaticum]
MDKGLRLEEVTISKGSDRLLSVNEVIAPGEVLSVMGPSGAGKSTLLAFLTGTLPRGFRATGRVILDGHDITAAPPHKRRMGLLFQDALLFQHMSVGQNLAFGLATGTPDRRARVTEALSEVDLSGYEDRDPATLSGGQRARVALMRMLLSDPCALLLDEPFSGLDADLRAQVRRMVFSRAMARDLPVLLVTHDAEDARAAEGRILRIG